MGDTLGAVVDGVGDTVGAVVDGVGDTLGGVTDSLTVVGEQPIKVDNEYRFLELYLQLTESERMLIGHSFGDFVKDCLFRQRGCLNER